MDFDSRRRRLQTDDYAQGQCEYHLERKGVAVPAAGVVNDEPMCARCFAGAAIHPFEKLGDELGAAEDNDARKRYFAKNAEARSRKRLRDARWRSRQRAGAAGGTCQQSVSA
jgi:hypothetical protein